MHARPLQVVDEIEDLGKLAIRHKIGLHVDNCTRAAAEPPRSPLRLYNVL